jgi:hypothetical protein
MNPLLSYESISDSEEVQAICVAHEGFRPFSEFATLQWMQMNAKKNATAERDLLSRGVVRCGVC